MADLYFYSIDKGYVDYLRKHDSKVPNANYHEIGAHEKLYCGVVILIGTKTYFAPLSHQISNPQSSTIIKHRNGEKFASLRLKYMIPVIDNNILRIKKIEEENDPKYQALLSEELTYCRQHKEEIIKKAKTVYNNTVNKKDDFETFCCDFKILEKAAENYKQGQSVWFEQRKP